MANDSGNKWPALTYESLPWELDDNGVSRSQLRKHHGPYRASIAPEIAELTINLPSEVVSDVDEAGQEIARFDEYLSSAFGEHGGEIAPMSAILLRTESTSSSQIENLRVGARQIALAELGERSSENAQIVTGNVRSMEAALARSQKIDDSTILKMHNALLSSSQPEHAGRWREQQVWIGGSNIGPHLADFVPPSSDRVPSAIADLLEFVDRDDIPVVAQVALVHAQFETIHPFADGNGRTGRALVHAMLTNKELARRVTVPISAGLLVDTGAYFNALSEYREGNIGAIIAQFTQATLYAVATGRALVVDLSKIRESFNSRVRARRDSATWKIADLLIGQPVLNTAYASRELGISTVAAQRAIDRLEDAGILTRTDKNERRNRVWQSREILNVLDEFAADVRRSTH